MTKPEWQGEDDPGALKFTIDFPYQVIWHQRPKGWRLLWHRIRWFPRNVWYEIQVWWWKRTGQWDEEEW